MLPLQEEEGVEITGVATDGDQAITLARKVRPDVILMDLNMPYLSGLAAMERIMPQERAPAVLVLTGLADAQSAMDAFAAGAKGYLRKDMITDELLLNGIFTVACGGVFVDATTFDLMRNSLPAGSSRVAEDTQRLPQLTAEERALLRYVALGYDNVQIAQQLQIAPKTVSNRLSQLYLRLQVTNRVQAANFALRSGLVDLRETG